MSKPQHPKVAEMPGRFVLSWRTAACMEAVFWTAFLVGLKFWVQPELQYQNAGANVFNQAPFGQALLTKPGTALEWLHAQGLQGCQISWLGALLGTVLAWAGCTAIRCLPWLANGAMPKAAHLIFGPWFFLLLSQYDTGAGTLALGFASAVCVAAGAVWLAGKSRMLRWLSPWFCLVVWYGLAGMGPVLFTVVAGILTRWNIKRSAPGWELLNWLAAGAACLVADVVVASVPLNQTLAAWPSITIKIMAAIMTGMLGALMVIARLCTIKPHSTSNLAPTKASATGFQLPRGLRHPAWQGLIWMACMAVGGLAIIREFNHARHQSLKVDYLAAQRRWPELVAYGRSQSKFTPAGRVNLLRALYHTGQLPENLFSFAIVKDDDLLPGLRHGSTVCPPLGEVMLELGQINQAEHFSSEAVEIFGERPEILWVLAQINILKGHPLAAANFLRVLRKQAFQNGRARHYLEQLESDPRLEQDPVIADLRSVMVKTDFVGASNPTGTLMQQLLHTNPTNRMAFEFLMTHYLVTLQIEKFMDNWGRFQGFNYRALPRHYEEAALLAGRLKNTPPPNLPNYKIRAETRQRYAKFDEIVRANITDLEAIKPKLARDYGDTYWFFFLYGHSAAWRATETAIEKAP